MNKTLFGFAARTYYALDSALLSRLPVPARRMAFNLALSAKSVIFPSYRRADLSLGDPPRVMRRIPRKADRKLPAWLVDEIGVLRREVDPLLFAGSSPVPSTYQSAWPQDPAPMKALRRMQAIAPSPRYVVIAPWLKKGGADLVIIKHLAEFAARGDTCLITTEQGISDWLHKVPSGISIIEAGGILAGLGHPVDRRLVLARYLIQAQPETVHLVNSRLGWETIRDYGKAVAAGSSVFASLFCDDDVRKDGTFSGYAHDFLPHTLDVLSGIISDNSSYLRRCSHLYGADPARLHVAYVWTDHVEATPPSGKRKVLWAGRLDRQKRPDLLLGIARACPEVQFDVYGSALLTHDRAVLSELGKLGNVCMAGAYDGFGSLPTGDYAAFLYTTAWDGLPNVLLEAGMRGMCVVATAVDGIPELVTEETGWPVDPAGVPQAYVRALSEALGDRIESTRRGEALRRVVCNRHARARFSEALNAIPSYF